MMIWLSDLEFQVSKDTPVRRLRALTGEENIKAAWLVYNAFTAICEDFSEHIKTQREEAGEDPAAHFVIDETSLAFVDLIDAVSAGIKDCMWSKCFPYLPMKLVCKLSSQREDEIEFGLIHMVISDFDRENEFMNLTTGEARDIIDVIRKLNNRRLN